MTKWETVIGLEVHVQLNTKSKLFSPAPNRFGDEPNTNISVVCTGQPGALPVLNREAVRKAVQFGCAIGAEVKHFSKFERKSYFYPDSPRNFQITQFTDPIIVGGTIIADVDGEPVNFAVEHAHLEDDAGMLKHFSSFAGVDYNRAGAPLLEIVSEPCMSSPKEAAAYARAIKAIMEYLGASDCNMEEGSLRVDANTSVRPVGETKLRTKTEIKNMNSFSNLEAALGAEARRQIRAYEADPDKPPEEVITQATYRFDANKGTLDLMRRKEYAHDYRYFPEPDLVPIVLDAAYVDEVRATLPELPYQRRKRYVEELQLTHYTAGVLTVDKLIADYFEEALAICPHPQQVANWITVEFFGRLKDTGKSLIETGVLASHVGGLVGLIKQGKITGKIAKRIADDMVAHPGRDPEAIIAENPDYRPVEDAGEVEAFVDKVLENEQQSVADYRNGKKKAFGFLVGQVMQASRGKAPPQLVNQLLKQKLETS